MAVKIWYDSQDQIPESLRSEYKQQSNGRWKLDSDDLDGVDNPQEMKRALGAANSEAGNRRKAIEKWEKLGKSPEEIEQLLADQQSAEQQRLEQKGQWDTLKQQMLEQHNAEKTSLLTAKEEAETGLQSYIAENAAMAALAEHKGVAKVLLPHVLRHVKVVKDDNGKHVARVLGEDGNPRVNSEGNYLGVGDLVASMKKDPDYARAFDGPSGNGGGAANQSGGAGGTPGSSKKRSEMAVAEKAAFVKEHGQEAYLKLPN